MNEYAWWRWLCGWVRFETDGDAAGRLLTLAARDGIALWNTQRTETRFAACCRAKDYHRLRPVARRTGRRLRVCERHGAAFLLHRYHARIGLPIGAAVYLVLLLWLSSHIWAIDIRGLHYADEAALRSLLAEHGVAVGAVKRGVDSESIRLDALTRLEDVSWLAVNLDGCIAEVELKEMNPHETPKEPTAPSNLVAARDGLVVAVEIAGGQVLVQEGDAVAAGNLLASGVISTAQGVLLHRSTGRVMAETTREITVTIPLSETALLPYSSPTETLTLQLFGWQIPLHDNSITADDCRIEEWERAFSLGGITLPLGVRVQRLTPLAPQPLCRTAEEATLLAQQALADEEALLQKNATVKTRHVTTHTTEEAVYLQAVYTCVENIAVEVPLQIE